MALALAGALAACGTASSTETAVATSVIAVATSVPTSTPAPTPTNSAPTVAATATQARTPTSTPTVAAPVTPSRVASVAPTRTTPTVARPATPSGTSTAGLDQTGACQITVPAGFSSLDKGLWYADGALLLLASTDMGGKDFATFSQTIPDMLASDTTLTGFAPGKEDRQPDRYRLDFTVTATSNDPVPSNGLLAAVPATDSTACIVEFLYHSDQQANYTPVADQIAASLQATKR